MPVSPGRRVTSHLVSFIPLTHEPVVPFLCDYRYNRELSFILKPSRTPLRTTKTLYVSLTESFTRCVLARCARTNRTRLIASRVVEKKPGFESVDTLERSTLGRRERGTMLVQLENAFPLQLSYHPAMEERLMGSWFLVKGNAWEIVFPTMSRHRLPIESQNIDVEWPALY